MLDTSEPLLQERVDIVQCYKCWSYGHRRVDCNEKEDKGNEMRGRCAGIWHKETDCVENALVCKLNGIYTFKSYLLPDKLIVIFILLILYNCVWKSSICVFI